MACKDSSVIIVDSKSTSHLQSAEEYFQPEANDEPILIEQNNYKVDTSKIGANQKMKLKSIVNKLKGARGKRGN